MEKNDPNLAEDNTIGLISRMREEYKSRKEIDMLEELSRPWRRSNTDKIYCGIGLSEHLQKMFDELK